MSFEFADNITSIVLNAVMTLALAGLLLLLGYYVRKKIPALAKYCIPAPVIGGFIFMFVTFADHVTGTFQVKFTNIFQGYFMLAFFTTVGLGASLKLLKKGGLLLMVYWLCCGVISVFQNLIGIGVGTLVGVEAPYALLASAISMIGGHGAALSYGGDFVRMGYPHGTLVGAAAARRPRPSGSYPQSSSAARSDARSSRDTGSSPRKTSTTTTTSRASTRPRAASSRAST